MEKLRATGRLYQNPIRVESELNTFMNRVYKTKEKRNRLQIYFLHDTI